MSLSLLLNSSSCLAEKVDDSGTEMALAPPAGERTLTLGFFPRPGEPRAPLAAPGTAAGLTVQTHPLLNQVTGHETDRTRFRAHDSLRAKAGKAGTPDDAASHAGLTEKDRDRRTGF